MVHQTFFSLACRLPLHHSKASGSASRSCGTLGASSVATQHSGKFRSSESIDDQVFYKSRGKGIEHKKGSRENGCTKNGCERSRNCDEPDMSRVFNFGTLEAADPGDDNLIQLDRMSQVSLKTLLIPNELRQKLELMVKQFGHKKDLETLSEYIAKQEKLRSHSELPRILPSKLVSIEGLDGYDRLKDVDVWRKAQQMVSGGMREEEEAGESEEQKEDLDVSLDQEIESKPEDLRRKSQIMQQAIDRVEQEKLKYYFSKRIPLFPEAAVAYAAFSTPGYYASHFRVLNEIYRRAPTFQPMRLLEYGAKAGAGIMAARDVWMSNPSKLPDQDFSSIVAVEPSLYLAKVGDFLTSGWPTTVAWRGNFDNYKEAKIRERHDLIISSFALGELGSIDDRAMLIRNLWNQLTPDGILSVLEPGTPTGFRWIHEIRELFITVLGSGKFHFVAPGQKDKDYASTSLSFLVIRKGPGPRQQFRSSEDAPTAQQKSYFWPRIISPNQLRPKECRLEVCTPQGQLQRLITKASDPQQLGHKAARRSMWGDLWRYRSKLQSANPREDVSSELLALRLFRTIRQFEQLTEEPKTKRELKVAEKLRSQHHSHFAG